MRLASCVAIELFALVTAFASAAFVVLWSTGHFHIGVAEASMRRPVVEPSLPVARMAPVAAMEEPSTWQGPLASGTFMGIPDPDLLEPLLKGKLASVRFNHGGSSISLRLTFADGTRAAFKPQQTNRQTVPRKEVAAYRISRLLGLSSVPPAIGRSFRTDELFAKLAPASQKYLPRLQAEIITHEELAYGELSWWIPVIRSAEIDGHAVDSAEGIVSFVRRLSVGGEIDDAQRDMLSQISNLLLFDYVIGNPDRWSGGNAKASEDGKTLYFMDNTLSFSTHPEAEPRIRKYLERTQRFSRRLVSALRELDPDVVRSELARDCDPWPTLLSDEEIEAMFSRRDDALAYVDGLIAAHGEDQVMVFP